MLALYSVSAGKRTTQEELEVSLQYLLLLKIVVSKIKSF